MGDGRGPEPGSKQTPATPETGLRKQLRLETGARPGEPVWEGISVQQEKGRVLQKLHVQAAPIFTGIYRSHHPQQSARAHARGHVGVFGSAGSRMSSNRKDL